MNCRVCFQHYNTSTRRPKTLVCGHTFCSECLTKLQDAASTSIRCPTDRETSTVPEGGIAELMTNFAVLDLLSDDCFDCHEKTQDGQCLSEHCSMLLCSECRDSHLNEFRKELISDLEAMQIQITNWQAMCDDNTGFTAMMDQWEAAIKEINRIFDAEKKKMIREIRRKQGVDGNGYFEWQNNFSACLAKGRTFLNKALSEIMFGAESSSGKYLSDLKKQITSENEAIYVAEYREGQFSLFDTDGVQQEFEWFMPALYDLVTPSHAATTTPPGAFAMEIKQTVKQMTLDPTACSGDEESNNPCVVATSAVKDTDKVSSHSRCDTCSQQMCEPHFLECGHSFCRRCVITFYNEHVTAIKMRGQEQRPTHFPCGLPDCKVLTRVPEGGLRNLPRSSSLLTGAKAALTLGAATNTSADAKQFTGSTLKWRQVGYESIRSVAVMVDGCCLLTSADGKTTLPSGLINFTSHKLQRLSALGELIPLPFPCFATWPVAISVNQSSTAVVLVDGKDGGKSQVSVYTKHSDHWKCESFSSKRKIETLAVTEDSCIICTSRSGLQNTLIMMSFTGEEVWSRSLAEGCYQTHVSVCKDLIVTSCGSTNTVILRNRQGQVLHTLPSEFICQPRGVISDSAGRLIIADQANKSISLFTREGHFIQTLVTCRQLPQYISLSQDRFLLVVEWNKKVDSDDLSLYELY